jgi:hypothetical protein
MRKLYIHIGFHKTGSSSLQWSLKKQAKELLEEGWEFLSFHPPSGNSSSLVKVESDFVKATYSLTDDFIKLLASAEKDNVIISAEHLCFLTDAVEIKKVFDDAKSLFDEVHIIAFLRRQDKLARSFKEQSAKTITYKSNPGSILMGHSPEPLPEATIKVLEYFDFNKKVQLWLEQFGSEFVQFFDFDLVKNEGVCTFFSKLIGMPFNLKEETINESLSLNQNRYWHLFTQFGLNQYNLKQLRDSIRPTKDKIVVHKKDAEAFLNIFSQSNNALSKTLSLKNNIFDDNMDNYNEGEFKVPPLDIEYLIKVLWKSQYGFEVDQLIDQLRDNAILLSDKGIHLKEAQGLLAIANKLRPQGALIRNKKDDLDSILSNDLKIMTDLERLDYYMPLRKKNDNAAGQPSSKFSFDRPFLYTKDGFDDLDVAPTYFQDLVAIFESLRSDITVPVQFGDNVLSDTSSNVFVKARDIGCTQSMLLKLNTARHWKFDISGDIPWDNKGDNVIWRGATTGYGDTRLLLVKKYYAKYDIGFSKSVQFREIDGRYIKPFCFLGAQLRNKFILSIEGNDVATNLKWILASNSVPIMPKPTKETWLMEGLLEPFIHYLPIKDDFSDLENILLWAKDNDVTCREIALNGKRYMAQFKDVQKELYLQRMLIMQYLSLAS